jgi:hypothetical protein
MKLTLQKVSDDTKSNDDNEQGKLVVGEKRKRVDEMKEVSGILVVDETDSVSYKFPISNDWAESELELVIKLTESGQVN